MAASPEGREIIRRYNIVDRLTSPVGRAMGNLLGRLTPSQWAALRREEVLVFSTEPRDGELPLPPEMARTFRESPPRFYAGVPRGAPPAYVERARQRTQELRDKWAAATGFRVVVRRTTSSSLVGGGLALEAEAAPFRGGEPADAAFIGPDPETQILLRSEPGEEAARPVADTPERRDALEADPVLGVPKRFQVTVRPQPGPLATAASGRPLLREVLPDLARAYGVHFIADAYWTSSPRFSQPESEPTALFALLDRATRNLQGWEHRDTLIRLRSHTWFFDRPCEIPFRLVRRWKEIGDRHGALPLEAMVEAAVLRDEQLNLIGPVGVQAGLPPALLFLYHGRHALRLYGALSPTQRQALWQGATLPMARMTASQRALFLAAWKARHRTRPPALLSGDLDPAAAGLSLSRRDVVRTLAPDATGSRVREEPVMPPATGKSPAPATPGAAGKTTAPPRPQPSGEFRVSRIEFRIHNGPERHESITVDVASP